MARTPAPPHRGSFFDRDNIENILIAILLALLFRAFEAEAFVIPTGSMAPTLMGRHKDIRCEQCGFRFQTGETDQGEPEGWFGGRGSAIVQVICPMCRYPTDTRGRERRNAAVTGDRILVNKFAYQHEDPRRWDVIVFKYPGNRKQNYIKRLVGLPGETIKIEHGDVFTGPDAQSLTIARKPAAKLPYILQLVHDTRYLSRRLIEAGWPSFWFDPNPGPGGSKWQINDGQDHFQLTADDGQSHWLRYRHVMPTDQDWDQLLRREGPVDPALPRAGLITDFYAYNAWLRPMQRTPMGWQHWVGDLALEANLQVLSQSGIVHLDLVEGGQHFRCDVDVATGDARLTINGGQVPFDRLDPAAEAPTELTGKTSLKGRGPFQVRFANVDNQLLLWVDDSRVQFSAGGQDHPGTYSPDADTAPQWSAEDPGDLYPLGIGGTDISLSIHRLRVLRDIYYISPDEHGSLHDYADTTSYYEVADTMRRPETWNETDIFAGRRSSTYQLGPDQFFPMGDNSPFSKDARIWSEIITTPSGYEPLEIKHYVPRDLLIGKAFLVYWPHGLDLGPIPLRIVPNVTRMKWIR